MQVSTKTTMAVVFQKRLSVLGCSRVIANLLNNGFHALIGIIG